jgi:putative oxidoreductase
MIAHDIRHCRTLEGTGRWFGGSGFREPKLQAAVSAAVAVGSGTALPVGAAPSLELCGVRHEAVAARTVHVENGYIVVNEG